MSKATATSLDTKVSVLSESGIFPWSWQGWKETFVNDEVHLFVNGFAAPDRGMNGIGAFLSGDRYGAAIIDLYMQKGIEFIKFLRGSFALALWDAEQQKLILATDHFGTRPIYYWLANERIAFAPRITGFANAVEIPKIIEANSLYFYLNHSFIPAPLTIYKNIRRLEPGHTLVWANRRSTVGRYWDMTYVEDRGLSETAAADLLRESLEDSVRFALRSGSAGTGEIGAFLSGGTDSSTLVGLMAKSSSRPTNSFSVGFAEEAYNEIHYARIAAKHFKSVAHEYFVRPEEALNAIPTLAAAYDEPFGNSSAIPTYFCLKMARDAGVSIMFAGDGGDELFGGNERYITEKVFSIYHQVPRAVRSVLD
ncbi:MAG: asparagine synthetase B family protein, partial [Candidatus Binatia bacterium]